MCDPKATCRRRTLGSIDLRVPRKRFIKVVKRANSKGSALVRRLGNLVGTASKGLLCRKRGVCRSKCSVGGLHARMKLIFRCPRCRLFRISILDSIYFKPGGRKLSGRRYRGRTERTLRLMKFPRGCCGRSPFRLSKNRGHHITVTKVLTVRPGMLILSRPATKLSPGKQSRVLSRMGLLRRGAKVAMVLISRDVRSITGCIRHLVIVGSKRGVLSNAPRRIFHRCGRLRTIKLTTPRMACMVRSLGRGKFSMSTSTAAIRRTTSRVCGFLGGERRIRS